MSQVTNGVPFSQASSRDILSDILHKGAQELLEHFTVECTRRIRTSRVRRTQ